MVHLHLVLLACLLASADSILVRANNRTHHGEARDNTFGCFFGDLSTQQAFAAAAQARASKGGELLLFNVNAEYVSLALRLVGNLARLGERNYLALAFDAEVSGRLHKHGVCGGHTDFLRGHAGLDAYQLGLDGSFADRREKTILFTLKLQALTWAVEAGVKRVLHLDLDVVILHPPFLLFSDDRFGPVALACAMDIPTIPHTLSHLCASKGAVPPHTTVPRQRLNTGALFVDGRRGGAVWVVNETLKLILKRFDDAFEQPPPPCATCPFPLLPDWDLVWEQVRRVGRRRRCLLLTCSPWRSLCSTRWWRRTRRRIGTCHVRPQHPSKCLTRGAKLFCLLSSTSRRARSRCAWWAFPKRRLGGCAPSTQRCLLLRLRSLRPSRCSRHGLALCLLATSCSRPTGFVWQPCGLWGPGTTQTARVWRAVAIAPTAITTVANLWCCCRNLNSLFL